MEAQQLLRNVELLSELVVDVLRDLYRRQQAFDAVMLCQRMTERPEIIDILTHEYLFVARAEAFPKDEEEVTHSMLQDLFEREAGPSSTAAYLKQFQGFYLGILESVERELGKEEQSETIAGLQKRIRASRDLSGLISSNEELLVLVQAYTRHTDQEREQVANFIAEIGKNLMEIESHLFTSFSHTKEGYQANDEFNAQLEQDMAAIGESIRFSESLTELKELVVTQMANIKVTIDNKRQEDEIRLERANEEIEHLRSNLDNMKVELVQIQEQTKDLQEKVFLDPLTGVYNRRAYEQRLREELQRFHRYSQHFSILLYDVDHFKRINDVYGHWVGDNCLRAIVRRVGPALRESDFLARYGGEEFVVLLPGTDVEGGRLAAERLRNLVEKTRFHWEGQYFHVTISIGVTQVQPSDKEVEELFNRVDAAMYQAKSGGRNRVVVA